MRAFLKQVQNTVSHYQLWSKKESFIVAVSGGPDSLCLLDVLFLLSQKYDFVLHVAHVNYRLRGTDSDLDEALVRERTQAYGLSLSVLRPKQSTTGNLEEKLRDIRYDFFEKLRVKKRATLIALAHHEDDQAETFLLRLLRGSGMTGLSSMSPKAQYLVRPFLKSSRQDILRYLKERNLSYRLDKSNNDIRFLRNRIRKELLPLLERHYQPQIKRVLADTAALLALDYQYFETLFSLPHTKIGTDLLFSAQTLSRYEAAPLRHQLRLLLTSRPGKRVPTKGNIDELLKVLKSTKSKHQRLSFDGLNIERKGDTVRLLDFYL